ncbi:MAG: transcription termination factor NusA [Planctomycetes bacterium]|jgi:N utilization substance protein A|nr:transcription termination factor NusA [Planctomycetota bacterium]
MSEILNAIKQICEEKNLDYNMVLATIELALAAAYRKDFGEKNQNIKVVFDPATGKSKIFDVKTVVENLPPELLAQLEARANGEIKPETETISEEGEETRKFNPKTEIQLSDALMIKDNVKIDDEIITELPVPDSYGRMAAQTAKQVIIQKLREVERDMVFSEFKDKEHEVVGGIVQRREGRFVLVDLGKAIGLLPAEEQIMGERYNPGERVKVYIKEVRQGNKGAEIILSRKSEEILRKIFYLEIPEVANGLVEIKSVSREAGSRSKVAICTDADNVDPIGSCVGQRGARIQTIISELGGEKVDIILYDEDPAKFVANALSPAKILDIEIDDKKHKAVVKVASDKLSLAIGKNGQNVRLAAHLTGWRIDIIESSEEGDRKVVETNDDGEIKTEAAINEVVSEVAKDDEVVKEETTENPLVEKEGEKEEATKAIKKVTKKKD